MLDQLQALEDEARRDLAAIAAADDLEQWRVRFLGRKSAINDLLGTLGTLPPEERRAMGQAANRVKRDLETAYAERETAVAAASLAASIEQNRIDISLPGRPVRAGGIHPITRMIREVSGILSQMGFDVVSGPEVEWDHYNFEMLNIPRGHPARDAHDTFWITPETAEQAMLLRTHTSPMQIRIMQQQKPPVRVAVPGRVFRYEATDSTHESVFHQIEGLAVDEGITMADLKGTLQTLMRRLFGERRKVRFRCDFFPFVEPGVEVAIDCFRCDGVGCTFCRGSGWIEVAGAGMVHPRVLEGVAIDPTRYTGFAFGFGVERLLLLTHQIDDIRLFHGNDLRFLRQFA